MRRKKVGGALAGLCAVALLAGGCTERSGNAPDLPNPGTAPSGDRTAFDPPTAFGDEPASRLLWPEGSSTSRSYWPHIDTLTLHGELAITYGQTEPGVTAVDMSTGEVRWHFPVAHDTARDAFRTTTIVDIDGEPVLFAAFQVETPAEGTTPSGESLRLYALDLDGEELWRVDVPPGEGPQLGLYPEVVAADAEHVVVNTRNDVKHLGSVAVFSVADRELAWHRDHFAATALWDGIVVGEDTRAIRGLTAAEGAPAWQAPAHHRLVADGSAAWLPVAGGANWENDFHVVEAATGTLEQVRVVPDPQGCFKGTPAECVPRQWTCFDDERSVTSCLSVEPSSRALVAFDNTTGEPLWQLPHPAANRVAPTSVFGAWHGALYAELEDQGLILDLHTGEDRATGLAEVPIRVNEHYGVVRITGEEGLLAAFVPAVG